MRQAVNRRAAQLSKLAIKLNSEDFTVFCRFSGHIQIIDIDIHIGGWISGSEPDWKRTIYLNLSGSLKSLEQAIKRIQEIKDNGSIAYFSNVSDQGELTDGR